MFFSTTSQGDDRSERNRVHAQRLDVSPERRLGLPLEDQSPGRLGWDSSTSSMCTALLRCQTGAAPRPNSLSICRQGNKGICIASAECFVVNTAVKERQGDPLGRMWCPPQPPSTRSELSHSTAPSAHQAQGTPKRRRKDRIVTNPTF